MLSIKQSFSLLLVCLGDRKGNDEWSTRPGHPSVRVSRMMSGQHAYLRSGWNVMDGGLVAISLYHQAISHLIVVLSLNK